MTDPRATAQAVTAASLRGAVDLSALVERAARPAQQAAPGAPDGGALPDALVVDGTDADFSRYLELSMQVPVIVDLWAEWCAPCKQLSPVLEKLVAEYDGRLVLVKIDVDSNPQLAEAFQAQSIPTVAAVIGGRPVSLFAGAIPEAQVRDVFEQVLQLAEQNGVTGRLDVTADQPTDAPAEPEPEPLPPHHQDAYDAIDRGDWDGAMTAYRTAIAQDPRDALAVAGLAQVGLLARLDGISADAVRAAAAAEPKDPGAQLAVADLDLSGGHVDDAFARLLDVFPALDPEGREAVRLRLIDFFEIVGVDDARTVKARARLGGLLY